METLNKHIHLHIVPMYFLLCFSLSQCAFIVLKVVNIIKKNVVFNILESMIPSCGQK